MSYLLIIGAKSDIAKATAKEFAKHGYDLYLAARQVDELASFAKDITVRTERVAKLIEWDVCQHDNQQSLYHQLEEKPLGVLVAVGYLGNQEEAQVDFTEAQRIMDTNYVSTVHLLNMIADDFARRQCGFIIGISSVAGERGRKSNYLYGSAKSALSTYLSGLRNRLYSENVQVLTIKPGFVATKMTANMDLPAPLTTQPEVVAKAIYHAQHKGKDVIYSKPIWRWIMWAIKMIPEWQFKKMSI